MKIKVIKQHGWNGGLLMQGREYHLPHEQAKMLIREGIAISDEWPPPKNTAVECAAEDQREEMAVTERPKPRRRRRNANSRANT